MDPAFAKISGASNPALNTATSVRRADASDAQAIANLMYFELSVHRHLDWRAPLDWVGSPAFWVVECGRKISAALACPPDPPGVAWVRLFVHDSTMDSRGAWDLLWPYARKEAQLAGNINLVCIATQGWMQVLLQESGFKKLQDIVLLDWRQNTPPVCSLPPGTHIRAMTMDDLPAVAAVDASAFAPLWQNSLEVLRYAYPQAAVATVAESHNGLLGYQLSTRNPFGVHLARLAVRPESQGQGIGAALTADLICRCIERSVQVVSVNTQSDNAASLKLYQKLGFRQTGEQYPVYSLENPSD